MEFNKVILDKNSMNFIANGNYIFVMGKGHYEVTISSGTIADIILEANEDYSLKITADKDSKIRVGVVNNCNGKKSEIAANINENVEFFFNLADFSNGENNVKFVGDLNGEFSKINCHIATVTNHEDNKVFDINVNHNVKNTFAKVESYGVSKEKGRLVFSGTSHIKNGSIKSNTNQIAKGMIFDESAIAVARPILRIDENDVVAAHSAAVGKINDEHIFYLTSRGLTIEEARQIITLGYLKPIINEFDEQYRDKISKLIEGNL